MMRYDDYDCAENDDSRATMEAEMSPLISKSNPLHSTHSSSNSLEAHLDTGTFSSSTTRIHSTSMQTLTCEEYGSISHHLPLHTPSSSTCTSPTNLSITSESTEDLTFHHRLEAEDAIYPYQSSFSTFLLRWCFFVSVLPGGCFMTLQSFQRNNNDGDVEAKMGRFGWFYLVDILFVGLSCYQTCLDMVRLSTREKDDTNDSANANATTNVNVSRITTILKRLAVCCTGCYSFLLLSLCVQNDTTHHAATTFLWNSSVMKVAWCYVAFAGILPLSLMQNDLPENKASTTVNWTKQAFPLATMVYLMVILAAHNLQGSGSILFAFSHALARLVTEKSIPHGLQIAVLAGPAIILQCFLLVRFTSLAASRGGCIRACVSAGSFLILSWMICTGILERWLPFLIPFCLLGCIGSLTLLSQYTSWLQMLGTAWMQHETGQNTKSLQKEEERNQQRDGGDLAAEIDASLLSFQQDFCVVKPNRRKRRRKQRTSKRNNQTLVQGKRLLIAYHVCCLCSSWLYWTNSRVNPEMRTVNRVLTSNIKEGNKSVEQGASSGVRNLRLLRSDEFFGGPVQQPSVEKVDHNREVKQEGGDGKFPSWSGEEESQQAKPIPPQHSHEQETDHDNNGPVIHHHHHHDNYLSAMKPPLLIIMVFSSWLFALALRRWSIYAATCMPHAGTWTETKPDMSWHRLCSTVWHWYLLVGVLVHVQQSLSENEEFRVVVGCSLITLLLGGLVVGSARLIRQRNNNERWYGYSADNN